VRARGLVWQVHFGGEVCFVYWPFEVAYLFCESFEAAGVLVALVCPQVGTTRECYFAIRCLFIGGYE